MPALALAVVTHNSAAWISSLAGTWHAALRAAALSVALPEIRVAIADAASQDDTPGLLEGAFPGAQLLRLPNRGFGACANAAIARLTADWIILCNADVSFPANFLTQVQVAIGAVSAHVACIAPWLLNSDGTPQLSIGKFPTPGGILRDQFRPRPQRKYLLPQPAAGPIDWATGACLILRREAFHAVGGFDENYFLYVEEVDLQKRLHIAGHQVHAFSQITVTHHHPNATRRPRPQVQRYAARGTLRYFAKFGGGLAAYRLLALLSGRLPMREALAPQSSILERATGP